ncbi:hypothetical protein [Chondromyces crocatus]|uniref:GHMP family kinase ATP-binding protein n=1 Tax=Chondromyces crocatus TaxID=52 RepID=UPI0024805E2A|nr:hypothetical protein [Chondromyces crocatus]
MSLRTTAVVEPFDAGWVRLAAPGGGVLRRSGDPPRHDQSLRLLEAALAVTGVGDGVSLEIDTDVEPGAGLGGSAAATVAALLALRAAIGETPTPADLAREAAFLERGRLRIPGGDQDPIFAAHGGVLDLTFDGQGCSGVRAIGGHDGRAEAVLAELQAGLLLVDTGVRRVSGEVLRRRATPDPRVTWSLLSAAGQVARGLAQGSLEQVVEGMRLSAEAKAKAAPSASVAGLEIAEEVNGLGAEVVRVCGAGGGGHVLVWAPPERHADLLPKLSRWTVRQPSLDAPGARIEES